MNELVVIPKSELQQLIQSAVLSALVEVEKSKKVKNQMNIKEAAAYINISVCSLNRKKDEGIIPFSKLGGRVIFSKYDLDEYVAKNKSTATYTATQKKVS
jgi:excisionase family DNA binding protein